MTAQTILFVGLGAFSGGFINGLAGTGTALFALGFYLVVLDPVQAVAIVAVMSVVAGVQGLWVVRKEILAQPHRLLRFLVPGLLGVPIGLSLLDIVDASTLRIATAVFLIVYGGYFGFRSVLPAFSRRTPILDSCIGFIGGVLGGAASLSGAVPAMWLSLRPWPKSETRAVLQPYNISILGTAIVLLFFKGAFDRTTMTALLVAVPSGIIAVQIGIMVFRSLSDTGFRRLLIILMLAMGLGVMASEIL